MPERKYKKILYKNGALQLEWHPLNDNDETKDKLTYKSERQPRESFFTKMKQLPQFIPDIINIRPGLDKNGFSVLTLPVVVYGLKFRYDKNRGIGVTFISEIQNVATGEQIKMETPERFIPVVMVEDGSADGTEASGFYLNDELAELVLDVQAEADAFINQEDNQLDLPFDEYEKDGVKVTVASSRQA